MKSPDINMFFCIQLCKIYVSERNSITKVYHCNVLAKCFCLCHGYVHWDYNGNLIIDIGNAVITK